MKKIEEDIEMKTSKAARTAGLRRIPRKHIAQPGEVTLADCKVRVTLELDANILEHFKARAANKDASAYQTQINQTLRASIEDEHFKTLINNEEFIAAVAAKVATKKKNGTRRKAA
jgi:uncharacterized protein (DUF4415 family)